jgi:hypothetical protein
MLGTNASERGTNRHLATDINQNSFDLSGFEDFDFNRALLSFDHRDDIATLHQISGLDHPLDECASLHIGAEGRHAKFGHGIRCYARPSAALAAAIIFAGCGIAASSRWRA